MDAGDVAPEMRVRVPYPVHPSGHLLFVGRVKSATRDGTVSIWQWECGDTYVEEFDMMTVPIEVDTDRLPDGFVAPAGPVLAAHTPIAKPSANSPVRPTKMPRTRKSKKRPAVRSAEVPSESGEGVGGSSATGQGPSVSRGKGGGRRAPKKPKAQSHARPPFRLP